MTINSNSTFNQFINSAKHSTSNQNKEKANESFNDLTKKDFEIKNKLGIERYDSLLVKNWFDNTVFEKDENINRSLIAYLDDISYDDYNRLIATFQNLFGGQLMKNSSGEIVVGPPKYNHEKSFETYDSTVNFFEKYINKLREMTLEHKFDNSYQIKMFSDLLDTVEESQEKS